uniref:CxC2-like cysteine cluster KDZ transposase-associated domain-containing protein n=1 Tax=Mycena chlorophos TaxID=658473 RepID=A0ABQ0KUB3_MYCCL|nr:predicted protein [Mycena chlorophos]
MAPNKKRKGVSMFMIPDTPAAPQPTPLSADAPTTVIHHYTDVDAAGHITQSADSRHLPTNPSNEDVQQPHVDSQLIDSTIYEVDLAQYAREIRESEWNGSFFKRRSLKALGLRIQIGPHKPGTRSPQSNTAPKDDFVVIDTSGVHEVGLDFCGCPGGGLPTQQLLCAGLLPATEINPRSAATIRVMRHFHLSFLETNCNANAYYDSLRRQSDNTGLLGVRDRYDEFLRMTKKWRHLQMLKRAGRGHDPSGATGTAPGECALLCPACPHPGKNLPINWEQYPEEKAFLFALFLAIDANFRLRRKDVSSEKKDPGLGHGWAFFCEVIGYMEHVKKHWNDRQPVRRSICATSVH